MCSISLKKSMLFGSSLQEIQENCGNPKGDHVATSIFTWSAKIRRVALIHWHVPNPAPSRGKKWWVTQHCTSNPLYRSCCFNVTCSPVSGSSSHSVHHMPHTAKHHKASMYHGTLLHFLFTNKIAGKVGPSEFALKSFFQFGRMSTWISNDQKSVGPADVAKWELRWNRQIYPFPWAPMYGIPTYIYHKFKSR